MDTKNCAVEFLVLCAESRINQMLATQAGLMPGAATQQINDG